MNTIYWLFTILCFLIVCVDCQQWESWMPWSFSKCSKSCGPGVNTVARIRQCNRLFREGSKYIIKGKCPGSDRESHTANCSVQICPDAVAHWGPWKMQRLTVCTVTCNVGIRVRYHIRQCLGLKPVKCGSTSSRNYTELCYGGVNCREEGKWSSWHIVSVGSCEESCTRQVHKKRTCDDPPLSFGRAYCVGDSKQITYQECNIGDCRPVDGKWSAWSKLDSRCSSFCNRTVNVTRHCNNPAPIGLGRRCSGHNIKTLQENCIGGDCLGVDGQWSPWSKEYPGTCTPTCKNIVTKNRTCTNPPPFGKGQFCNGSNYVTIHITCTGGQCVRVNGQWSAWEIQPVDKCPPSCLRLVTSTRHCTNPAPFGGGQQCSGENMTSSAQDCTGDRCVNDGIWSAWESRPIGECLSTCKQKVSLTRTCINPGLSLVCVGNNSKIVFEDCCQTSSKAESDMSSTTVGITAFTCIMAIIAVASIFIYCRSKRIKQKHHMTYDHHHKPAHKKHAQEAHAATTHAMAYHTGQHIEHGHAKHANGLENIAYQPD